MKRLVYSIWSVSLILAFGCSMTWAQATAQISGTARDQSGAVLPGVEITVTQTETGIARSAVTNESGSYVLTNLPLGPYRLEAGLPGFRTYAQTGIVLQVNSSPVVNPVLEVGQVTEQVEVQANATLVETRTVGVGQVVETGADSGSAAEWTTGNGSDFSCGRSNADISCERGSGFRTECVCESRCFCRRRFEYWSQLHTRWR